jgi:hypothetical protein
MFAPGTDVSGTFGPSVLGLIGLGCIISPIMASGGKIGSLELAIVKTPPRQIALGVFGIILAGVAVGWALKQEHDKTNQARDKIFHLEPAWSERGFVWRALRARQKGLPVAAGTPALTLLAARSVTGTHGLLDWGDPPAPRRVCCPATGRR